MTILGIDTVAIVVSDRRKAIAWYRDALGLEIAYIGPNSPEVDSSSQGTPDDPGHWIELGPGRPRTRVHLCELGGTTEPGPSGITFLTDDIQRDYERMRGLGVRFPSAPEHMDWGEWLCQFLDPDGNEFDLKQPIDVDVPREARGPLHSSGSTSGATITGSHDRTRAHGAAERAGNTELAIRLGILEDNTSR